MERIELVVVVDYWISVWIMSSRANRAKVVLCIKRLSAQQGKASHLDVDLDVLLPNFSNKGRPLLIVPNAGLLVLPPPPLPLVCKNSVSGLTTLILLPCPISLFAIPSLFGTRTRRMSFFSRKKSHAATPTAPSQVTVAQTPTQALAQLSASASKDSGNAPQHQSGSLRDTNPLDG